MKFKKIISVLLCAFLVTTGINTVCAATESITEYTKTDLTAMADSEGTPYAVIGGNIYYCPDTGTITGADKTITEANIPENIDGVEIAAIGDYAFANCSNLTNVTIPNGVTSIGDGSFAGCSSLPYLVIPDSVTYIDNEAFILCSSLTDITIPDGVLYINFGLFTGCSSLKSITIPNKVTYIVDYAFWDCDNLTSVTIPGSVIYIGNYAFWDCNSLTSVTIPDSVTSIGAHTFDNCNNLKTVYCYKNSTADNISLYPDGTAIVYLGGGTTETDSIIGDPNNDGVVSASDAADVLQKALNPNFKTACENIFPNTYFDLLDVNGDGTITATDAAYVLQKALNSSFKLAGE